MKHFNLVFLSIIFSNLNQIQATSSIIHAKQWTEPDAWTRSEYAKKNSNALQITGGVSEQKLNCNCPNIEPPTILDKEEQINNKLSVMFYKKLLKLIFDQKTYNYDDFADSFKRELHLTVTTKQMNILFEAKDPRDWDACVSDIFEAENKQHFFRKWTQNDSFLIGIFPWLKNISLRFLLMTELSFTMFALAFIFAIIIINKKYNYGMFATFVFLSFIIGFVYTYYDCNKKLELEELASIYNAEQFDHCENLKIRNKSWSIFNIFRTKSTKHQCFEYLKEKHIAKPLYCRPDDVLLFYMNEKILNVFHIMIEKLTKILNVTFVSMPFPYNLVATALFIWILPQFLSIIYAHLFDSRVWFRAFKRNAITTQTQIATNKEDINGQLINKLLLEKIEQNHKITEEKISNLEKNIIAGSGVQVLQRKNEHQTNVKKKISDEGSANITTLGEGSQSNDSNKSIKNTEKVTTEISKYTTNDDCFSNFFETGSTGIFKRRDSNK